MDGRLDRGSYDISCDSDCNPELCGAGGSVDCRVRETVEVPYTTVEEECREEPRQERSCPDVAVTRLR